MKVQVGDENSRASNYGFSNVGKRNLNLIKKEIEDGVKIIVWIGGEEFGVHVENAADCRELESHGGETNLNGFEGGESGGARMGILPEGFPEIDIKVILEVEYFLPEKDAGVGVVGKLGIERKGEPRFSEIRVSQGLKRWD